MAIISILAIGAVSAHAVNDIPGSFSIADDARWVLSRASACTNPFEESVSSDCFLNQALDQTLNGVLVSPLTRFATERGRVVFGEHFRVDSRLSWPGGGSRLAGDIDAVFPVSFAGAREPSADGGERESSALFFQWGMTRWTDEQGTRRDDIRYGVVRRIALSDTEGAGVVGFSALFQQNLERGHGRLVAGLDFAGTWGSGWLRQFMPTTGWRPGGSGLEERALAGTELGLRVQPTTTIAMESTLARWDDEDGSGRSETRARVGLSWRPHPWLSFRTGWEGIGTGEGSASFRVTFSMPLGGAPQKRPRWEGLGLVGGSSGSYAEIPDIWRPVEDVGRLHVVKRSVSVALEKQEAPMPTGDRAALVALYNATGGATWTNSTNWLSDAPLGDWHGVTTGAGRRVSGLSLASNGLSGTIPAELGALSSLRSVYLQSNQLSGAIPAELGALSNLQYMFLSSNRLSGAIPAALGELANLQYLYLRGNQLTGCVPDGLQDVSRSDVSSLGLAYCADAAAAPELVVESAAVNDADPDAGTSFTLSATVRNRGDGESGATTLRYYRSTDATITTSDTEVGTGAVEALSALGTSDESVGLTVPSSAGTYYYGACVDSVTGETDSANNCSSAIALTVQAATQPMPADDRAALVALYNATGGASWTNSTSWLSDAPLHDWHGVTTDRDGRVTGLALRSNGLSGTIPPELGTLSNLRSVYLQSNQLSGAIPAELGALSNLQHMFLSSNRLSGAIPAALGELASLRFLYLRGNQLTGCVPDGLRDVSSSDVSSLGLPYCADAAAAPELVVESAAVSDADPDAGESFMLSATVRNQGDGESAATTLRYYRSTDATIVMSDTEIGTRTVEALAASGTSDESVTLTAPSSAGTYYYGACVEPAAGETETANNCSGAVALTVQAGAAEQRALDLAAALAAAELRVAHAEEGFAAAEQYIVDLVAALADAEMRAAQAEAGWAAAEQHALDLAAALAAAELRVAHAEEGFAAAEQYIVDLVAALAAAELRVAQAEAGWAAAEQHAFDLAAALVAAEQHAFDLAAALVAAELRVAHAEEGWAHAEAGWAAAEQHALELAAALAAAEQYIVYLEYRIAQIRDCRHPEVSCEGV